MKTTTELAVDVVLFLPTDVADEMITLSNHLNDTYSEKNRLNTTDRFPHISLLMGVVKEADIEKIGAILNQLKDAFLPIHLSMSELKSKISSSAIEVAVTADLKKLQAAIIKELSPFLTNNPTAEMFYEEPNEKIIEWVRNFSKNCTGEGFHAHITVGPVFENESYDNFHDFSSDTLALCHVGLHGSCRKVLAMSSSEHN